MRKRNHLEKLYDLLSDIVQRYNVCFSCPTLLQSQNQV